MGDLIRLDEHRGQRVLVTSYEDVEPEYFETLIESTDDGMVLLYGKAFLAEEDDALGLTPPQARAIAHELLRLADQAEHC